MWYLDIFQNNPEWVRGGDLGDGEVTYGTELAICCFLLKLVDGYMDIYCTLLFLYVLEVFIIKNLILKKSAYILCSEIRTVRAVVYHIL